MIRAVLQKCSTTFIAGAMLGLGLGCEKPQGVAHGVPKDQHNQYGSSAVSQLAQEGDYYLVSGADLHNLDGDLIGKRIKFTGVVRDVSHVPVDKALLLSEDNAYFVIIPYGSLGEVPDNLKIQLNKGGLQTGNKITVYCTIEQVSREGGLLGSALKYKSCIVKPVYQWQRAQ